jgi:two-component system response regulator FlrC
MSTANVMVVEDDSELREALNETLTLAGYHVATAEDGQAALQQMDDQPFDLVVSDIQMPRMDGHSLLKKIKGLHPELPVMLMTAYGSIQQAVDAMRDGAIDYMVKPFEAEVLVNMVSRYAGQGRSELTDVVAADPQSKHLFQIAKRVAQSDATVMITGESGVGKEVVARAIHHYSHLHDKLFLPVNCGAIPENLLESQLFGHAKGAFTGALAANEGLFQKARGGTIFLDEIGDLPPSLQVKLLRAIADKEILPLGSNTPVRVDLRIIAATNRDLHRAVEEGRFREDLYYRLNVVNIEIPPLRERREDIPQLVEYLVRRQDVELKKSVKGVDNATMKLLMSLPWKGNIRELENAIEHAMIVGHGEWITPADLPRSVAQEGGPVAVVGDNLKEAIRAYERGHIENVLRRTGNDKRKAADLLGVSLSSLYRKIEELAIVAED